MQGRILSVGVALVLVAMPLAGCFGFQETVEDAGSSDTADLGPTCATSLRALPPRVSLAPGARATIELENTGSEPVEIADALLSGSSAFAWADNPLQRDNVTTLIIPAGERLAFDVQRDADATTPDLGTIAFECVEDTVGGQVTVDLDGP